MNESKITEIVQKCSLKAAQDFIDNKRVDPKVLYVLHDSVRILNHYKKIVESDTFKQDKESYNLVQLFELVEKCIEKSGNDFMNNIAVDSDLLQAILNSVRITDYYLHSQKCRMGDFI